MTTQLLRVGRTCRAAAVARHSRNVQLKPLSRQPSKSWVARSGTENSSDAPAEPQAATTTSTPTTPAPPTPEPANAPAIVKGSKTALATGVISVVIGVAYLALVAFLDMRGGEMLPPPPEAYLP